MLNNKQKAVLHVAKARTGLSEEDYRALLSQVGVESSRDLDQKGFDVVMKHFEKLGFKSTFSKKPKPMDSKARLMAKLYMIRRELNLPESYLDGCAQRMFNIDSYKWLNADKLHKLVSAMSYHQRRMNG